MGRYTSGGVGRDVLAGAVAGGAAVWLISKMDWSLSHTGAKQPGAAAAESHPAQAAASRAAGAAGVRLTEKQQAVAGHTVHYGVGIAVGALYGLLRGMAPSVTTARGSLFGVATFILGDEIGAPAMGLTKGPLEYSARDHGRSALAHIVFGLLTDLGTRLLSPWKSEVVILRGPTLGERIDESKQAIADGRDYLQGQGRAYLDRGRELAHDYADQARDRLDELDVPGRVERGRKRARAYADDVASNLPDRDDVSDLVERGRDRVRGWARDLSSRFPDRDDVEEAVETGRKRARGWAKTAREGLPDRDDVNEVAEAGRERARGWFRSAANRLPDRDDVQDVVDEGRRRGKKALKQARSRLPDRDDVDDTVEAGRKRARQLADDASDTGSSGLNRLSRWLFG